MAGSPLPARRPGRRAMRDSDRSLVPAIRGPITLITVGVLFAFNNFTNFRFHQTWPVLLIVFGLLTLLRRSVEPAPPVGPAGWCASPPPRGLCGPEPQRRPRRSVPPGPRRRLRRTTFPRRRRLTRE